MMTMIRKRLGDFVAILVLAVIAIAVGGYILSQQRLRFPFVEEKPFVLKAEIATAQAVLAGQGQTINVSGVRIGDIGKVELKNGRAVIEMLIDPEYRDLVRTDATALLRTKTGLKDMFLEVNPGSDSAPVAKRNFTISIRNTLPDVNPDEILSALDADTRAYLQLLVNGLGKGLDQRGNDLQEVFRRFEPTHRDLARVTSAVATRQQSLQRLITSLNRLNGELAANRTHVSQLVESSSVVFRAFASEQANISRAIALFPGALRQTTDTLGRVERFAQVLGPTANRLVPVVRSLDRANRAVRPFALEAAPIVRTQIRPFVRNARPVVRDLRPASADLARATPDLTSAFTVLNHLFNMLGYNPGGAEAPTSANLHSRREGFLFFIAWLGHQGTNLFSTADAHGSYRPTSVAGFCSSLRAILEEQPELAAVFENNIVSTLLVTPGVCAS